MANGYNKNNPGATYNKGLQTYKGKNLTDQGYSSSTAGWAQGYNNPAPSSSSSKGSSSNKGSSSSSGSSAGTTSSYDYSSDIANAILAQKQAALKSAQKSVNKAYDKKIGLLGDNYNAGVENLRSQYNNSANVLQNDAAKSLKEAYINKMLTQKTLGQQLSAQGFSGGATESTMAGLHNNYGNARNDINTTLNDNLTSLNNTLQNNLANLRQNYNSALADAETARSNALAQLSLDNTKADLSSLLSSNSTFMRQIQDALANQAAYEGTPTEANNPVAYVNTQQVNDMGNATQYAKYLNMAKEIAQLPYSDNNTIVQALNSKGLNPYEIQRVMNMM